MACTPGVTSGETVIRSATSRPRWLFWAVVMPSFALLLAMSGCGRAVHVDKSGKTTASIPLAVCGTVLSESAAGPVLYDASGRKALHASAEGLVYIRFAADCRRGYHIRVQPPTAAVIARRALADDGQPAAVAIRPRAPRFSVIGERDGQTTTVNYGSSR